MNGAKKKRMDKIDMLEAIFSVIQNAETRAES